MNFKIKWACLYVLIFNKECIFTQFIALDNIMFESSSRNELYILLVRYTHFVLLYVLLSNSSKVFTLVYGLNTNEL